MKIKLIGFSKDRIVIDMDYSGETVRDIIKWLRSKYNISYDDDEIMAVCGEKQLYLDDSIPKNCNEIELYPLAQGG